MRDVVEHAVLVMWLSYRGREVTVSFPWMIPFPWRELALWALISAAMLVFLSSIPRLGPFFIFHLPAA